MCLLRRRLGRSWRISKKDMTTRLSEAWQGTLHWKQSIWRTIDQKSFVQLFTPIFCDVWRRSLQTSFRKRTIILSSANWASFKWGHICAHARQRNFSSSLTPKILVHVTLRPHLKRLKDFPRIFLKASLTKFCLTTHQVDPIVLLWLFSYFTPRLRALSQRAAPLYGNLFEENVFSKGCNCEGR